MIRKVALMAALSLVSSQAHPGHQPFSEGAKHFLSNPNHIVPALIFASILFAAAGFLKHSRERAFLRIFSVIILTAALFS